VSDDLKLDRKTTESKRVLAFHATVRLTAREGLPEKTVPCIPLGKLLTLSRRLLNLKKMAVRPKEETIMKAGIIFTGSGPLLVLTSYDSFTNPDFVDKMNAKGVKKFLGYEVPVELCKGRYGEHYPVVLNDLRQTDDLRVLDYDGHHIFLTFSFKELGEQFSYE
jgi:hypothetical protein